MLVSSEYDGYLKDHALRAVLPAFWRQVTLRKALGPGPKFRRGCQSSWLLCRRLRVDPGAVSADQLIRFLRAPGSGLIGIGGRDVAEDGLDYSPLRFDQILASEEIADSVHRVAQQSFIGRHIVARSFGEIEFNVIAHHTFTRHLDSNAQADGD